MTPFLHSLTPASIHTDPFPLMQLLDDSLYYPSSHFDGAVVKAYAYDFASFVYCDYGVTEDQLLAELQTFRGYNVLAHRPVREEELIPNGWTFDLPSRLRANYADYPDCGKPSSARWAVYERKPEYTDMHGPVRFSLLSVRGEGVATYQALYWSNQTTAKAVALVTPATGFGPEWTDFLNSGKVLGYVVTQNPHGRPDFIAKDDRLLHWKNYPLITNDRFCRYTREHIGHFQEYSWDDNPTTPPTSPSHRRLHNLTPEEAAQLEKFRRRRLEWHSRDR